MPPDGIDPATRSQIEELAFAQFDGNVNTAYRHVLETGLATVAVPRRPAVTVADGDLDRVRYTDANDRRCDGVFLRFFPKLRDRWYTIDVAGATSMDRRGFRSLIRLISRYADVDRERAAFSLTDWDGQWYGWGFADFLAALAHTTERRRWLAGDDAVVEDGTLLFTVDNVSVCVNFAHDVSAERIEDIQLYLYSPGEPVGNRAQLTTIANHFGGTLGMATPFERFDVGTCAVPIEPVAYLTEPFPSEAWVSRVVIECESLLPRDAFEPFELPFPRELVLNLKHHAESSHARDYRYQLENFAVAKLQGGRWNVALEGNWYNVEAEASK